jgi:hypothetical protein
MNKIFASLLFFSLIITFSNCKKNSDDSDTQIAQDNTLAEGTFNDVNNIANQACTNGNAGLATYRSVPDHESLMSGCATFTIVPDVFGTGATISVNFGPSPCLCLDHRFRSGIINIHYTGNYQDSGTVNTITFQDYFVGPDVNTMY